MGRCADLLDADQFNNVEALVDTEPTFDAVTEDLRQRLAEAELNRDVAIKDWLETRVPSVTPPSKEQNRLFCLVYNGDIARTNHVVGMREAMEIMGAAHFDYCNKTNRYPSHDLVEHQKNAIGAAIAAKEGK